jgi:pyruvate/2-oxoacid:ferredoxin oxidoreductase alpha subunit
MIDGLIVLGGIWFIGWGLGCGSYAAYCRARREQIQWWGFLFLVVVWPFTLGRAIG